MRWQRFAGILTVAVTIAVLSTTLVSTAWAAEYKVIYKFRDASPSSRSLVFDTAGNLYGTTSYGGTYGLGTVFKLVLNPDGSWTKNILYSFAGGSEGVNPNGAVVFDKDGNIYGTTAWGGSVGCSGNGCGTVFQLTPNRDGSWTENVLHVFDESQGDGIGPVEVTIDDAGNLYGTTYWGGGTSCVASYGGCGTVFELAPNPDGSWTYNMVHRFSVDNYEYVYGVYPWSKLISDGKGNFYGVTLNGGTGGPGCDRWFGCGTVYKLTPNPDGTWSESVLYSFRAGRDGLGPRADLTFDALGNLYGTTASGGIGDCEYAPTWPGCGTVFRLTPNPDGTWVEERLHVFKDKDGGWPASGLIFDAAGNLYGTTYWGGAYESGTVFKMTAQPDGRWTFSKLRVFKQEQHPFTGFVADAAGNFYGVTPGGGYGYGVVFKITP